MKNSPFLKKASKHGSLRDASGRSEAESTKIFDILKRSFKSDCERCSGSGLLATNLTCTTCKGKGKIFIDLL